MKRLIITLITMCALCLQAGAQTTMTSQVTKTEHKSALKAAASVDGKFYFKSPDKMSLTFKDGKEALLMTGTTYTLVRGGKKSVAKGAMIDLFRPLQTVLKTIITKGDMASVKKMQEVSASTSGSSTVLTITPKVEAKRTLFSSFVVTYNTKSLELESIRMNGRKTSYTDYVLSKIQFGQSVDDKVFK